MEDRRGRPGLRARTRPGSHAPLAVTREDHDRFTVLTVTGELDITSGSDLRDALHDLIGEGINHHVVDLRRLSFLDSTGLGLLVGHHKRLAEHGGTLQVVCGPGLVSGVFRLTGVDQRIPVKDNVAAAASAIGGRPRTPPPAS